MTEIGLVSARIAPIAPLARGAYGASVPSAFGQDAFVRTAPVAAPAYQPPAGVSGYFSATSGAEAPAHGRRASWFIAQLGGLSNPYEDVANNQNCGPTAVAMIAKAFGRLPVGPAGADAAIEETRARMGATPDELQPTDTAQLVAGAESFGLRASHLVNADLATLQAELAAGKLPIACVVPKYLDPAATFGHFTVVTAVRDGLVYLNDPGNTQGPMAVPVSMFMDCWQQKMGHLVSIGA